MRSLLIRETKYFVFYFVAAILAEIVALFVLWTSYSGQGEDVNLFGIYQKWWVLQPRGWPIVFAAIGGGRLLYVTIRARQEDKKE